MFVIFIVIRFEMFALSGTVVVLSIYKCIQERTFSTLTKANNILNNDPVFKRYCCGFTKAHASKAMAPNKQ